MNGLIAVMVAHDTTCKPGDEWMFHDLPKTLPEQCPSKDDAKVEKPKMGFEKCGCLVFVLFLFGLAIWKLCF